jgi:hypothetical protein
METPISLDDNKALIWFSSLNINGFVKYGWEIRERLCADVISKMPAQLMGFQEFAAHCQRPFQVLRPELEFIYGEKMKDIHNVIAYDLTRFKLLDHFTLPLSPSGKIERAWGGSRRTALMAKFHDTITENDVVMVNFHLDHESLDARYNAINLILNTLSEKSFFGRKLPMIITCDSNVSVASPNKRWHHPQMNYPYHKMAKEGFTDCWVAAHPNISRPFTYHGFRGHLYQKEIDEWGTWDTDWNMVNDRFVTINSDVVDDKAGGIYPSDHFFMSSLVMYAHKESR